MARVAADAPAGADLADAPFVGADAFAHANAGTGRSRRALAVAERDSVPDAHADAVPISDGDVYAQRHPDDHEDAVAHAFADRFAGVHTDPASDGVANPFRGHGAGGGSGRLGPSQRRPGRVGQLFPLVRSGHVGDRLHFR